MEKLVEAKVVLGEDEHVILKQFIQPDEEHEARWLNLDMSSLSPEKDGSGLTSESAFILGIATIKNTTEGKIRDQLKQEGVIHLYPPHA